MPDERMKKKIIKWIEDYFDENGPSAKAIVGISGGKDSTVVAALCVEALGRDRVIGVLMPDGVQSDYRDAKKVVEHLHIPNYTFNINAMTSNLFGYLNVLGLDVNSVVKTNTPSRLRMAVLYAFSAAIGGRVANTGNRSEAYIGYTTKYGDRAGDFAPLADLTVSEVYQVGETLGIPKDLLYKTPSDGMSGKTDEENFGFTYEELDKYLLTGEASSDFITKVEDMHRKSAHKLEAIRIPFPSLASLRPKMLTPTDILTF